VLITLAPLSCSFSLLAGFSLHFFCSPGVIVHFLCLSKENEPKEKTLSQKAFLQLTLQNQGQWPKLPTGIRQFLTAITPYAAAKGFP
jgi:hypothetical protein